LPGAGFRQRSVSNSAAPAWSTKPRSSRLVDWESGVAVPLIGSASAFERLAWRTAGLGQRGAAHKLLGRTSSCGKRLKLPGVGLGQHSAVNSAGASAEAQPLGPRAHLTWSSESKASQTHLSGPPVHPSD
jgi:hypothetical protein